MTRLTFGGWTPHESILATARLVRRASFLRKNPEHEDVEEDQQIGNDVDPTHKSSVSAALTVIEDEANEDETKAPEFETAEPGDNAQISSGMSMSKMIPVTELQSTRWSEIDNSAQVYSGRPRTFSLADSAISVASGKVGSRIGGMDESMQSKSKWGGASSSDLRWASRHPEGLARIFRRISRSKERHHNDMRNETSDGAIRIAARTKLTEEDEAMLSDSDADYDAFDSRSMRASMHLFSPTTRARRWYSTFTLVVLMVFMLYVPVRASFFPFESGAWTAVDLMFNFIFFIDILVHLNTGFVDKDTGTVVYDRRAIFWRYARGWLIIDILAALPLPLFPGLGTETTDGNHELAFVPSFIKIFRLYGLLTMAQESHRMNEAGFLAVRTLLSVIVTAHIFGCGWYLLATLMHTECKEIFELPGDELIDDGGTTITAEEFIASECPWIYRVDYYQLELGRRYLGSIYWSLTTLTTVGYGDLSARTADEQIYSIAVQVVGVAWYSYIVGTWASVLNSFDAEAKEQRSKMREVVAFSKAAGLPPDMAKKVRQYFRFSLYKKNTWISFNEQEIVTEMTGSLRAEVIGYVNRHTIAEVPWLHGKDPSFIADVVILLKRHLFRAGDVLYREGTVPEELFFITSGRVCLKYGERRVQYLKQGAMAGLFGIVGCDNHYVTAVAQRDTTTLGLTRASFLEIMEKYPMMMQDLLVEAKHLARRVEKEDPELSQRLMANRILNELIVPMKDGDDDSDFGTYYNNTMESLPGGESVLRTLPKGWDVPQAAPSGAGRSTPPASLEDTVAREVTTRLVELEERMCTAIEDAVSRAMQGVNTQEANSSMPGDHPGGDNPLADRTARDRWPDMTVSEQAAPSGTDSTSNMASSIYVNSSNDNSGNDILSSSTPNDTASSRNSQAKDDHTNVHEQENRHWSYLTTEATTAHGGTAHGDGGDCPQQSCSDHGNDSEGGIIF